MQELPPLSKAKEFCSTTTRILGPENTPFVLTAEELTGFYATTTSISNVDKKGIYDKIVLIPHYLKLDVP